MKFVHHNDKRHRTGFHELHIIPVTSAVSEYFCCSCRQLRLSLRADKSRCYNCNSKDIITGPVGSLDKAKLIGNLAKDG